VRERAKQVIEEISEEYRFEIIELEIEEEHIHIMLSFPPSRSIGEVVRIIKSNSARVLFREFPGIKKSLWSGEMWEDGYFARTVGDRMTSDVIKQYIVSHRDLEQGPAQLDLRECPIFCVNSFFAFKHIFPNGLQKRSLVESIS